MMTEETGCGLLLDVNNVFVSAFNNEFDPVEYIQGLPPDRIVQMHVAGHQHCGDYIIDTHDSQVIGPVWELFRQAWLRTGGCATLLEWDNHIPAFEVYHAELLKARPFMEGLAHSLDPESPAETVVEEVSNPVSFLVNDIAGELTS